MKQEHWDEEQIESLLKQTPKMRDVRSKEEVFKRLQEEELFEEEQSVLPQKKFHWKSLLVSIASIFVIVLIASSFIGTTPELAIEEPMLEQDLTADEAAFSTFEMSRALVAPQRTALYEDQVGDSTPFLIGLAGDDAESVPISVLLPAERIQQDFANESPTKLALYEHYAPLINEEALGFMAYHPLVGELTEQNDTLTHTLPAAPPYDGGTAAMSNYIGVLVDTFKDSYEEIVFADEAGGRFESSQIGSMPPLELKSDQTKYNYFLYTMRDGRQYISPNFRMSYPDVETALQNMTTEANDIYQTLILPNVTFTTAVEGDVVTVTFEEPLDLEQQDAQAAIRMLEGMLLTARNFDKSVNFENISPAQWYDFDFTKLMPMPIAANLMDYTTVFQ